MCTIVQGEALLLSPQLLIWSYIVDVIRMSYVHRNTITSETESNFSDASPCLQLFAKKMAKAESSVIFYTTKSENRKKKSQCVIIGKIWEQALQGDDVLSNSHGT